MGQVIGPFDTDDWYTMNQLKLDLAFSRKRSKADPNYAIAEKVITKKLKSYMTRAAA